MNKLTLFTIIFLFLIVNDFCLAQNPRQIEVNLGKIEVDFVYVVQNDPFATTSAIGQDNKILPFATVKLDFANSLVPPDQQIFESQFRIQNEDSKVNLRHLHEINPNLPPSGENSSFYWKDDTTLFYTPDGLSAGQNYSFILPQGWNITNGWQRFQTLGFTGTEQRVYSVIIPGLEDWKLMTTMARIEYDVPYVDCAFQDFFNQTIYSNTEIRIRGYSTAWGPKKNYTIKFDKDNLFTGFKDSSGIYQGPREFLALVGQMGDGNWNDDLFVTNKLSYDTIRKLEKRILAVELAPDCYFGYFLINGRFWGVHQFAEKITSGKGGWSTMKNRKEAGFIEKGFLHRSDGAGKPYPEIAQYFGIRPETEYDIDIGEGDGQQTHWNTTLPYRPYVQYPDEYGYEPLEFDLEVEADPIGGGDKMELIPDDERALFPYQFFDMLDKNTGQLAGSVELFDASAQLDITFPTPVEDEEDVEVEALFTHDFDLYYESILADNQNTFEWLNLDSFLIHIFFCRLAYSRDNLNHNFYHFMNQGDFETFLQINGFPISPYLTIFWDGDRTFLEPLKRVEDMGWQYVTLPWHVAEDSDEARQRYINLFDHEQEEGGVLTEKYFNDKIDEYLLQLGNGVDLEEIRWHREIFIEALRDFFEAQLNDENFMTNYLLSLKPDQYIPPQFRWREHPHNDDGPISPIDPKQKLHRKPILPEK